MVEKSLSVAAFTEMVEISFTLCRAMRELQARNGGFRYSELANVLVTEHKLSPAAARERVWQHVSHVSALIDTKDGAIHRLVEDAPHTIADTVAGLVGMAHEPSVTPRPRSLRTPPPVGSPYFERFRPGSCAAKWRRGAPHYVAACYENPARSDQRYSVVFTWWRPDRAMANWQAGNDPRVQWCLRMSERPDHPATGCSRWHKVVRGRSLGGLVAWRALPEQIRSHVRMRVQAVRPSH